MSNSENETWWNKIWGDTYSSGCFGTLFIFARRIVIVFGAAYIVGLIGTIPLRGNDSPAPEPKTNDSGWSSIDSSIDNKDSDVSTDYLICLDSGGCTYNKVGCDIKGNVAPDGKRAYLLPGQEHYDTAVMDPEFGDLWFCTETEAQAWVNDNIRVSTDNSGCPRGCTEHVQGCDIKGDILNGNKIYILPGYNFYDQTVIQTKYAERWFCTEKEAIDNGWRIASWIPSDINTSGDRSSCPDGCTYHKDGCDIKGNISMSSGEKIYHVPGQEYYDDTIINVEYGERWFCTEEEARDNGWRKSWK